MKDKDKTKEKLINELAALLHRIAKLEKSETESKRAAAALRESETKYRTLFESANDAIFIEKWDRFIDCNTKALEMFGCKKDQIIGKTYDQFTPERHPDGKLTREKGPGILKLAEEGKPQFFEWQHHKLDGTLFDAEVSLNRMELSGEVFLLAIVRDITNRKRAELKLQEAFSEIKELKDRLEQENIYLREEIEVKYRHEEIIGQSDALKHVLSESEQVAKTDSMVLILGETGSGKELLARAIHNLSSRKARPMIKVNCPVLPPTLIESELFGHEKGAYTGALSKQMGRFEVANGSTIFLDEITELSLELQSKLLRVLQEGQFERLGSTQTIHVDVRVIAATNRDLAKAVKEGSFREDLYYRLNVFPISVPPLRERQEDIPLLVWKFVKEFGKTMGKQIDTIPRKSMEEMQRYPWPGNIRELRNVIERAMILSRDSTLRVALPEITASKTYQNTTLEEIERRHILNVLDRTRWRVRGKSGAAEILGLKPTTLEARIKKLGIKRDK